MLIIPVPYVARADMPDVKGIAGKMNKPGNRVAFIVIGDIGYDRIAKGVGEMKVCDAANAVMCVRMVSDKVADFPAGGGGEQDDDNEEK